METTLESRQALEVSGQGLITGLPVNVSVTQAPAGHGIVFYLGATDAEQQQVAIPARLASVANTNRGITLAHPSGKFLSITEHFLCAASLVGLTDLKVTVSGAPELPILDGSAAVWVDQLLNHFGPQALPEPVELKGAIFLRHSDSVCLYSVPADHLTITYAVDFPHPEMSNYWVRWDSKEDGHEVFAQARTFGLLRELPILQAQGLAKGVTIDNTLGLTDEGGFTSPLRMAEEPARHKIIDILGDLTLLGLNPLGLKAHIYAINAGHDGHIAFAKKLAAVLQKG